MNGEATRLLTATDVAALLCLKPETVRIWARKGKLPGALRIGGGRRGVLRFEEREILRYIERRRRD